MKKLSIIGVILGIILMFACKKEKTSRGFLEIRMADANATYPSFSTTIYSNGRSIVTFKSSIILAELPTGIYEVYITNNNTEYVNVLKIKIEENKTSSATVLYPREGGVIVNVVNYSNYAESLN